MSPADRPPTGPDLERYRRATDPDAAALDRMHARLRPAYLDDPAIREAAVRATSAPAPALARVRARLREPLPLRDRRWITVPAAALAAAVAAVLVAVAVWPEPSALDRVHLELHGEGQVAGTRDRPVVEWVAGRLAVRVEPHRGVQFAVHTPEALVEVVGTVFTVERERHATEVAVTEGRVRVSCAGRPVVEIGAGERHRCLPDDAAALLLRVTELAGTPAAAADQLEAADLGLALPGPQATRGELLAHRTRALAALDRLDDALASADAYLASGETARRSELLDQVARIRFEREGCAAVPALEVAVAEAPARPSALLLATCAMDGDPERARALVRTAGSSATGEWRDLADRLGQRLGVRW